MKDTEMLKDDLLHGKCPVCRGIVSEIELEEQHYSKRVLCLDCKHYGDYHTWGGAYKAFWDSIN